MDPNKDNFMEENQTFQSWVDLVSEDDNGRMNSEVKGREGNVNLVLGDTRVAGAMLQRA